MFCKTLIRIKGRSEMFSKTLRRIKGRIAMFYN